MNFNKGFNFNKLERLTAQANEWYHSFVFSKFNLEKEEEWSETELNNELLQEFVFNS
jgi:hypothetical protein